MIFDFLKRMVSKNKDKGYNSNLYDASELKKISHSINKSQEKKAPKKIVEIILTKANEAAKSGYSEINFASFRHELGGIEYYSFVKSLSEDQRKKVIDEVADILRSLNYKIIIKPSITIISWK